MLQAQRNYCEECLPTLPPAMHSEVGASFSLCTSVSRHLSTADGDAVQCHIKICSWDDSWRGGGGEKKESFHLPQSGMRHAWLSDTPLCLYAFPTCIWTARKKTKWTFWLCSGHVNSTKGWVYTSYHLFQMSWSSCMTSSMILRRFSLFAMSQSALKLTCSSTVLYPLVKSRSMVLHHCFNLDLILCTEVLLKKKQLGLAYTWFLENVPTQRQI